MTKLMTITRWIYNEKNSELVESIAPVEETKGTVTVEVRSVEKESEKAIQITTCDYDMNIVKVWIPKTQIKDSNFELEIVKADKTEKKEYTEIARFDSSVKALELVRSLKAEGKSAFTKYEKNDCIVMAQS